MRAWVRALSVLALVAAALVTAAPADASVVTSAAAYAPIPRRTT